MRKILALSMVMCLTSMLAVGSSTSGVAYAAAQYGDYAYEPYAPDQLDNLLAPIALYPDPLLAQVLIASTFPDQIQDAAGWVHRYGANNPGIDDQYWDVSVKAVAHYPTVLFMMNDQLDWTTALGQAYVNQSTDTMASVQHLRQLARSEGNLFSTPQQQIIVQGGYIEIVPAQPQYIFVPTYDPTVIYARRIYTGNGFGGFFSFGSGLAIGAWLNYDLDWGSRRVVYDGWRGGGWRERSRPYVHVTNVYVNNRYENVVVNRTVVNRQVNFNNVDRFNSVHRDVKFDNRARFNGRPGDRPNNNAIRDERAAQPSRPSGGFVGREQNQNPAPAPQQSRQAPRQNDNNDRGRQDRGGQNQAPPLLAEPSRSNGGFVGREQNQPPVAAPQQSPQQPRQNDNNNRGRQNRGGQNQAPAVVAQPSQPSHSNGGFVGREQNQAPAAAPQQSPQQPRQNDNNGRGRQNQAPPARVEQPAARPASPAQAQQPQQKNQPQGHDDHNSKDNKDSKDHRDH